MRRQLAIKAEPELQQPSTSAEASIPKEIRDSLKYVRKRFQFNIEQIEKRYCSNTSGLVFNLKNDNVEFDANECTAENDEELLNNVKREFHKHTLDAYGGTAILSTPAEDPDESDKAKIENWDSLNKLYDVYLKNSIDKEEKAKRVVQFREPLKPRRRGFIYTSAYQNNPANFKHLYEDTQQTSALHYSNELFIPTTIKQGSVAESHIIDEPIIQPLLPVFRTPRQYKTAALTNYESPMTRLKKQMLAIEENYEKRTDIIYAENEDWVERWVQNVSADMLDPDAV